MRKSAASVIVALGLSVVAALPAQAQVSDTIQAERVSFMSADGEHRITGYLFSPARGEGRHPAIVMLHGRGGAYSSLANGTYDASTLAKRHKMWGRIWADRGYSALMVDDFGPVGFPGGFKRGTYQDRPEAVDEVYKRPLHAYGALAWLRTRADIDPERIGLMGWSNGGSATLAAMADDNSASLTAHGFRAAAALYPGCGLKQRFKTKGYKPYAPVLVLMGTADEEVSLELCEKLVARSSAKGGEIALIVYTGATHSFDTPTQSRQSVPGNGKAAIDAVKRIQIWFDDMFARRNAAPSPH
ncbi:MAG: dienelactone hydrolase family protein [Sphingomonas sp.]